MRRAALVSFSISVMLLTSLSVASPLDELYSIIGEWGLTDELRVTGFATLSTCKLESVTLYERSSGDIVISGTTSGCPDGSYNLQIDLQSSDGLCDVQYLGGDIFGINNDVSIGSNSFAIYDYDYPNTYIKTCAGKTLYPKSTAACLYTGGPPGTGQQVSCIDSSKVSGALTYPDYCSATVLWFNLFDDACKYLGDRCQASDPIANLNWYANSWCPSYSYKFEVSGCSLPTQSGTISPSYYIASVEYKLPDTLPADCLGKDVTITATVNDQAAEQKSLQVKLSPYAINDKKPTAGAQVTFAESSYFEKASNTVFESTGTIKVSGADEIGLSKIEIYIASGSYEGTLMKTCPLTSMTGDCSTTYSFTGNTNKMQAKAYAVYGIVYDSTGQSTKTNYVNVYSYKSLTACSGTPKPCSDHIGYGDAECARIGCGPPAASGGCSGTAQSCSLQKTCLTCKYEVTGCSSTECGPTSGGSTTTTVRGGASTTTIRPSTTTTRPSSATTTTRPTSTTTIPTGQLSMKIYKGTNIVGIPGLAQTAFANCGLQYYQSSENAGCVYDDNGYLLYYSPLGIEEGDCGTNYFSADTMEGGLGYYLYATSECTVSFNKPSNVDVVLYPGSNMISVPIETSLDDIASICGDKTKIFSHYLSESNAGCEYDDNGFFIFFDSSSVSGTDGDCGNRFTSEAKLRPFVGYFVNFNGKNGDGKTSCTLKYSSGVTRPAP